MSNNLPSAFLNAGLPTNANAMQQALQRAKERAPETGTGLNYLKFHYRTGEFTLGAEEDEVGPDALFLVHPPSFSNTLLLADGREVFDQVTTPVFSATGELPMATRDARGKEEWRRGYSIVMAGLDDETWMRACEFGSVSMGGNKAFKSLMDRWIEQIQLEADKEPEDQATMPVISFSSESYYSKKAGAEIYNPIINVRAWVSSNSAMEHAAAGSYALEGVKAPAKRKAKAAPKGKAATKRAPSRSRAAAK